MRWLFATALVANVVTGCAAEQPCESRTAGTICRVVGTGEHAFNGDGLLAEETAFYLPSQVRRGPDGLLYVMDTNNHRLRRVDADETVTTIAGDGFHAGATEGAAAIESSLENPIDFDFLPDGRVVFVSYHDPRVLVIEADGTLSVLSGGVVQAERGNEGDGLPAKYGLFVEIAGIAVTADGTIYIADGTGNRIRVIRDGIIDTFAGTGARGYAGDGGPARAATLDGPTALAVDRVGNLYITDSFNSVVRRVSPDGLISTVAGVGRSGFSGDGGPATSAELARPDGIAVAVDGTLYVADRFNSRIRKISPDGTIATIAGIGTKGLSGDGGPAGDAQFGYLSRVQLDSDGGLLVSDQTNGCVRKILGER